MKVILFQNLLYLYSKNWKNVYSSPPLATQIARPSSAEGSKAANCPIGKFQTILWLRKYVWANPRLFFPRLLHGTRTPHIYNTGDRRRGQNCKSGEKKAKNRKWTKIEKLAKIEKTGNSRHAAQRFETFTSSLVTWPKTKISIKFSQAVIKTFSYQYNFYLI